MKVTAIIKVRNKNIKNKTRDAKIINKYFIEYSSRVLFIHVYRKRPNKTFLENDNV